MRGGLDPAPEALWIIADARAEDQKLMLQKQTGLEIVGAHGHRLQQRALARESLSGHDEE